MQVTKHFWQVVTPLGVNKVYARKLKIIDGSLVFTDAFDVVVQTFAPGEWKYAERHDYVEER